MNAVRQLKRTAKLVVRAASKGWCSADRIAHDLRAAGVREGATLLVHSSLSSMGLVVGGPPSVISALRAAIGPGGTLVLPTHSWERAGRGDFTFDLRQTPSCVGAISEAFRTMPGVVRSLHPTHSVAAIGPRSRALTEGHELASTPCGEGTPYARMLDSSGQILFLGATLDQNTIFHTLEAMAKVPYLMRGDSEVFTVTGDDGRPAEMRFRRHARGPERRFVATTELLESKGILRRGRVAASATLLVEAAGIAEFVLECLANEPTFLLDEPRA
jgi:aminoglycoside 3-N-acetyltransferase